MKELIAKSIVELREVFPLTVATSTEDGGAYITIPDFDFGEAWEPRYGTLSALVPFVYPQAQIYPFYGPSGLQRVSDGALVKGMTISNWQDQPAIQLSITQTGGWDPNRHTLLIAILGVQNFLRRNQ